ncbi:At-rich interactive domain protein [Thalictrum thalictroides]|uniref:At-rich interactive domain protein n=1 Tax=Thalictrum thalictroides TaxID=46969 RepID=A0A7J6VGG7_THATH|nr:At-rich interactive domain protein [Thalictrum thalictroides]
MAINGLCTRNPQTLFSHQPFHPQKPSFSSFNRKQPSHITNAKKVSSRTGRFDSKNKKGSGGISTTVKEEEEMVEKFGEDNSLDVNDEIDDGYFLPELPGDKPDFWEGPQWDGLGFFVQYQWAFGIGFALIACGIAVTTYNEGATDFKKTPVYQESIQSRELLEEPEASSSDVFEANPTEEAPSLD